MKDFNKKNVFITGGSSGIGLAAAKIFYRKGAHLALFARSPQGLEQAKAAICQDAEKKDANISTYCLDVALPEAVTRVMDEAVRDLGSPHVLINCAGRALPRPFEEVDYAQFDRTMRVNLYGSWNTVAALLPAMKEKGGIIVNTSSVAGLVGVFGYTDYCASKFALIGFSEALKGEISCHGIQVKVLCPPDTDTPGFEMENQTKPDETRAIASNAKLLTADQVAQALVSGMAGKKFLIIPGTDGKLTWLAKRLAPGLVSLIMDRAVARVRKEKEHGDG